MAYGIVNVGANGADGREVELRKTTTHIQWRYTSGSDTTWKNLAALSDLKGLQGLKGDNGDKGDKGDDGASAYESAQEGGYSGTEAQFYADLAALDGLAAALAEI